MDSLQLNQPEVKVSPGLTNGLTFLSLPDVDAKIFDLVVTSENGEDFFQWILLFGMSWGVARIGLLQTFNKGVRHQLY
jgi:hypothetical protein